MNRLPRPPAMPAEWLTSQGWTVEVGPHLVTLYHKANDVIATYLTLDAAYKAMGGK